MQKKKKSFALDQDILLKYVKDLKHNILSDKVLNESSISELNQ